MQPDNSDVQSRSSIHMPVQVSPRLPGGGVHQLDANHERIQIATWQGVYGNQESRTVLTIPFPQVIEIARRRPVLWPVTTCHVSYKDKTGKEKVLKFRVFVQAVHNGTGSRGERKIERTYTEAAARSLEDLRQSRQTTFPSLSFEPPASMRKLLTAGILFGGMVLSASLRTGGSESLRFVLQYLGYLAFSASLSALGIDYVRMRTGWHPVIKLIAYVVLALAAAVMFSILVFLVFEVLA